MQSWLHISSCSRRMALLIHLNAAPETLYDTIHVQQEGDKKYLDTTFSIRSNV